MNKGSQQRRGQGYGRRRDCGVSTWGVFNRLTFDRPVKADLPRGGQNLDFPWMIGRVPGQQGESQRIEPSAGLEVEGASAFDHDSKFRSRSPPDSWLHRGDDQEFSDDPGPLDDLKGLNPPVGTRNDSLFPRNGVGMTWVLHSGRSVSGGRSPLHTPFSTRSADIHGIHG